MSEFIPFRFKVTLYSAQGGSPTGEILCGGAFSEVQGLELTMEPKAIREGGNNWGEHQRSGPTKFSTVILKRGVTSVNDLWSWFDLTTNGANYGYRLRGEITVHGDGAGTSGAAALTWTLTNALPVKFKGPDLSSTANQAAIEELHLVHEGLTLERPAAAAGARS